MTPLQQQQAQMKAQKEYSDRAFKQEARQKALTIARSIKDDMMDANAMLRDADIIYQWLIKHT